MLCVGEIIEARHLPSSIRPHLKNEFAQDNEPTTIKQMEIILITQALRRSKGNIGLFDTWVEQWLEKYPAKVNQEKPVFFFPSPKIGFDNSEP